MRDQAHPARRSEGSPPLLRILAALLVLAAGAAPTAPPAAAEAAAQAAIHEQWYVTSIAGRPVGSVHERAEAGEDGGVTSTTVLRLVLNRMGTKVEMDSSATFHESPAGRLASVELSLDLSEQATVVRARAEGGSLVIEQEAGGQVFTRSMPLESDLLGLEGVRRLSAERLAAPGDEIRYQTFSPELAAVTGAARRVTAVETLTVEGRPVRALEVEEKLDASPLAATLWLDGDGRLLRSEQTGPFGLVEVVRSDAAAAARAAAGGELPEESYAATLVPTQVRIPRARRLAALELELTHRRPQLGWPQLEGPGQRVLERSEERLVLAVERRRPRGVHPFPVAMTEALRPYLEPNAFLQSDDPRLAATAREIVAGEEDLFAAALALQRWVAENMRFDMGVVLAPSVEVYEHRRGTCTEYAVLLATLARAVGIPSRLVMGFVYVDGIFGGHAWVEVLAGEEWIPLDGAVVADGPADAARFAFQRTSLAAGIGELNLGPSSQMFGQVDARVRAFQVEGELRRTAPAGLALYTVEGDLYRNPGLELTWRRPEGFDFVDLDRVWPDDTLAALAGPDGERAELTVRRRPPWEDAAAAARRELARLLPESEPGRPEVIEVAGRRAWVAQGDGRAALALPLDGEVWLLSAEAAGAADELLRRAAAGLDL